MPSRYYTRTTGGAQPVWKKIRLRQMLDARFRNSGYFFVFLDSRLEDWEPFNFIARMPCPFYQSDENDGLKHQSYRVTDQWTIGL